MIYANPPLGSVHGWGMCGKHVSRELSRLEPLRLITAPFDADTADDALELHELKGLILGEPEAARLRTALGTVQLDGPLLQCITNPTLAPSSLGYAVPSHWATRSWSSTGLWRHDPMHPLCPLVARKGQNRHRGLSQALAVPPANR